MDNHSSFILLDERWQLYDLSVLTKGYMYLYGFFYTLRMRENITPSNMPWEGGHSVVNFFYGMYNAIDEENKPSVLRIQYASPGFIELGLYVDVALDIAKIVSAVSASLYTSNKTYDSIIKGYRARKLAKLKEKDLINNHKVKDLEYTRICIEIMQLIMTLRPEQIEALEKLSDNDSLVHLKILLALYRRVEPLASLESEGKARFSDEDGNLPKIEIDKGDRSHR
ncbi:hypothetical protein [Pectobacterium cacticida]|uniref:hypothetical protein n=1 Tax=Pectobacterium cacticida TaxID=69221 RepID=UPI002FF17453